VPINEGVRLPNAIWNMGSLGSVAPVAPALTRLLSIGPGTPPRLRIRGGVFQGIARQLSAVKGKAAFDPMFDIDDDGRVINP
jgi:hypothetical protein